MADGPLIGRPLLWLQRALQSQHPQRPEFLQVDQGVTPVLDILQGGWPFATWTPEQSVVPQSTAGPRTLISNGPDQDPLVVLGLGVRHQGGAGTANTWLVLRPLLFPGDRDVRMGNAQPPANDYVSHTQIFGSVDALILIPPNYALMFEHATTAVGESFTVNWIQSRFPFGVNMR